MIRPNTEGAITLVVGWRKGKSIEGGRVDLTEDVAGYLRAVAGAAADQVEERAEKTYTGDSYLEDEEVFVLADDAVPVDNDVVRTVRSAADLPRVAATSLPEKPLLFHATVIGDDPDARAGFVRTTNAVVTAGPGRMLTRLRQSLSTIEEPVFTFDGRIDFVVSNEGMQVLNQKPFERLFRSIPEILERVPEWLGDIATTLPLTPEGLADLQEHCQRNSALLRRLRSIHERGHLATVTVDDIRAEAERQGIDPDTVVVDGALSTANVPAGTVLKLLNEDLMVGGLSGAHFEVDRKTPR